MGEGCTASGIAESSGSCVFRNRQNFPPPSLHRILTPQEPRRTPAQPRPPSACYCLWRNLQVPLVCVTRGRGPFLVVLRTAPSRAQASGVLRPPLVLPFVSGLGSRPGAGSSQLRAGEEGSARPLQPTSCSLHTSLLLLGACGCFSVRGKRPRLCGRRLWGQERSGSSAYLRFWGI